MRAKHNRKTGFQIGNLFFCYVQGYIFIYENRGCVLFRGVLPESLAESGKHEL